MRFHEYEVGTVYVTPKVVVSLEEIIAFAERYDPQYFHVDAEKAKSGLFKGIVASGMHSVALLNAEWVKMGYFGDDILGGLGIEVSWSRPVYPGDEIYGEFQIAEKVKSPGGNTGLVTVQLTGKKSDDKPFSQASMRVLVRV
ncbi:MaoC/PaaZ C-terminal domain-containing protein [Alicyclobacillus fastidiosus]|uniref:MaoC/PaaZ C-terminal domain-containing protein n=1 Tax=Alicyclobacillus fastidiosus TaxID=392011 RepID=A0ABY6ZLZ1_9BACL|nr:MaoC/PaaZ C-terminal domain-containing protein [Alicyclobacillus fastidiosus]WAH43909.1 MaoC/PaaZ C-terminal domain-containing protein [Alicyclobacillus fastidiosus]GMA60153.1 MaoC family dehydratase [Alicyclobacillus fastidiosus]